MSYDLYFTSPSISLQEFENYFSKNTLYEVTNGQAFYSNDVTGVYFSFNHEAGTGEDLDFNVEVSFNLNFYRPHFFGLEAVIEVERFVSYFNCKIEDPQNEGMGNNAFTSECFLKGWNAGNQFAVKAILSQSEQMQEINIMSTEKLEKIWRWNFTIADKDKTIEEDIFIPRIFFMKINGIFGAGAVWPDAIPTFIPDVDFLTIPREKNAPKKFLKQQVQDTCLLAKKDFPDFFSKYVIQNVEILAYKLPNPNTPQFIKKYVSKLSAFEGSIEAVKIDSVLNAELVNNN